MSLLATILVMVVALLHLYFLVLEMFLWTTPKGRKIFGTTEAFAQDSKALAANQGLYNGFLSAGLAWGVLLGPAGFSVKLFFLGCVTVAGIYGALTVNKRIFFIQAVPAIVAAALVLASA